jgi:FSR family fosmidomycin resistance protein-like MFS transporter
MSFRWRIGFWGYILLGAVVLGKALGGFAADRFGTIKTSALSLIAAAVLFVFGQIPFAGAAAVLLFNMTMPITLWTMAKIFPGAKGFAFGLLTFGLFIGFLPVYLGVTVSADMIWVFAIVTMVSLALLLFGIKKTKLVIENDKSLPQSKCRVINTSSLNKSEKP